MASVICVHYLIRLIENDYALCKLQKKQIYCRDLINSDAFCNSLHIVSISFSCPD